MIDDIEIIKWMNDPSECAKSNQAPSKSIIDEWQKQKGLIVVEVKSHEGTQVMIKL